MIRRFGDDDVDAVMSIWLNANLDAQTSEWEYGMVWKATE